jgi:hypothetical protein
MTECFVESYITHAERALFPKTDEVGSRVLINSVLKMLFIILTETMYVVVVTEV